MLKKLDNPESYVASVLAVIRQFASCRCWMSVQFAWLKMDTTEDWAKKAPVSSESGGNSDQKDYKQPQYRQCETTHDHLVPVVPKHQWTQGNLGKQLSLIQPPAASRHVQTVLHKKEAAHQLCTKMFSRSESQEQCSFFKIWTTSPRFIENIPAVKKNMFKSNIRHSSLLVVWTSSIFIFARLYSSS